MSSGDTLCSHDFLVQMSFYGESQFDLKFSQLLQLANAWIVELWDDCEHN